MPTGCKIPKKIREHHTTASGRYVVWSSGLLEAGSVMIKLQNLEKKKKHIPPVGRIVISGQEYYYCLYSLFKEDFIYAH
ncbi:MAG: hypothetical protein ABJG41_01290 [Cyclobacteriaceae bacterium]